MCHLLHSSPVSQEAAVMCSYSSQPWSHHVLPAKSGRVQAMTLLCTTVWTAVKITQLTSIKINRVALLEASCVFLELCIGKDSLSHPSNLHIPLHLGINSQEPLSQLEKPHVCALPCKYLFSLYISYCVWVFSLTLSCHMCGSWWHQLYEISTHAKNSWRSWNKFWVRWVSWAGTEISKGTMAACHPESLTWSMWALLAPKADSPWKKKKDLIWFR